MRAIILAAGQGSRLQKLTNGLPKPLVTFGSDTVLARLITQISKSDFSSITLVIGYKKELIIDYVSNRFPNLKIDYVHNDNYQDDVNIKSLSLGVGDSFEPFTVFEADCVFSNDAMSLISDASDVDSSWFSIGPFNSRQVGGIILSDSAGKVSDIKIVPSFDSKYLNYRKLVGVLRVGSSNIKQYLQYLSKYLSQSSKQYYLTPWIDNLSKLPCYEVDLSEYPAGAFNSPEEYSDLLNLFRLSES